MEKQLVEGQIGSVGHYEVDIKGSELVAEVAAKPAEYLRFSFGVYIGAGFIVDKLFDGVKKLTPDLIDPMVDQARELLKSKFGV